MKDLKFLILFLVLVVFEKPAYAYLDPGTGSMVIQILIAVVAACAYAIKTFWAQIKVAFKSILTKTK